MTAFMIALFGLMMIGVVIGTYGESVRDDEITFVGVLAVVLALGGILAILGVTLLA